MLTSMSNELAPTPRRRSRRLVAVTAAALLSLPLVATAASAQTPTDPGDAAQPATASPARLDHFRTRCLAEIDRRLPALDRVEQGASNAGALTDQHAATITTILGQERA